MKGIFSGIGDFIKGVWNGISGTISGILDGIKKGIGGIFETIGSLFNGIANAVGGVLSGIGNFFSGIWSGIKGIFGFQEGGVVPGPIGTPQLAIVHGGETIIPANFSKPLAIGAIGTAPVFLDNRIVIDGKEIYHAVKRAAWDEDKRMTGSSVSGRNWRIA